jgi:hypothetical protein
MNVGLLTVVTTHLPARFSSSNGHLYILRSGGVRGSIGSAAKSVGSVLDVIVCSSSGGCARLRTRQIQQSDFRATARHRFLVFRLSRFSALDVNLGKSQTDGWLTTLEKVVVRNNIQFERVVSKFATCQAT